MNWLPVFAYDPKLKGLWCADTDGTQSHLHFYLRIIYFLPLKCIHYFLKENTSVFVGKPAGVTGVVVVDYATEVVSALGEIAYS